MVKKVSVFLLCIALLLCALPGVSAASESEKQTVRKQITAHYARIRGAEGKASLNGYCGTVAGYQLSLMGIDQDCGIRNGTDYFDYYRNVSVTSGGYLVKTYAAPAYTLRSALNAACADGKQDTRNLLVCFNSTNTEEGRIYGHVCMIYAILDGYIYYCESFDHGKYKEGQPCCVPVDEFAEYYQGWASFEGIVDFSVKLADGDPVALFVEARRDIPLQDDPDPLSTVLRTVRKGERLYACCLVQREDTYYYQIRDGERNGFLPAKNTTLIMPDPEDTVLQDPAIPATLKPGYHLTLRGKVRPGLSDMRSVHITLSDGTQTPVDVSVEAAGTLDLNGNAVRNALYPCKIPEGAYTLTISAVTENRFAYNGRPRTRETEVCLWQSVVEVAKTVSGGGGELLSEPEDGWFYRDGTWHLYRSGTPVTGWAEEKGIRYYLDETGTVVTGETVVNGTSRLFSATGALITGWVRDGSQASYRCEDGSFAQGWQEIDGARYYFTNNGSMKRNGWLNSGSDQYYFRIDGTPATGWVTTAEGRFLFGKDGKLQARMVESGGKYTVEFEK